MEGSDMAALVRHEADTATPVRLSAEALVRAAPCEIARLYEALDRVNERGNPRTARLLAAGRRKMAQKLMEEAAEVALEAVRSRPRAVIRESADLVYQLVVLWRECGIAPDEVWAEMRHRADRFGLAEKLPKATAHLAPAAGHSMCGRGR
jgi:phosphoribosyl-ATP pyrophosphohydrolase